MRIPTKTSIQPIKLANNTVLCSKHNDCTITIFKLHADAGIIACLGQASSFYYTYPAVAKRWHTKHGQVYGVGGGGGGAGAGGTPFWR